MLSPFVHAAIGRDVGPFLEELSFPHTPVIHFSSEANGGEEFYAEGSAVEKLDVDNVETMLGANRYRLDSFPTNLFGAINSA